MDDFETVAELNATLVRRTDLNEQLAVVRIRPDGERVPWYIPGQYIFLGLPTDAAPDTPAHVRRRPFSIASSSGDRDALEFFVLLHRDHFPAEGRWTLREGDRLWVDSEARGSLTLEGVPTDIDVVMISTGTGIAPFISILRSHRGTGRWRRFVLINGVRRISDLGYREELESLAQDDPTVMYIPIVSREPASTDWPGLRGRVQQLLNETATSARTGGNLDPGGCHVFVCGNPEMVASVKGLLVTRGFRLHTRDNPGNIHLEQ